MPSSLLLSFKKNTSVSEFSKENFVLKSRNITLNLKQLSPGLLAAIAILGAEGATEEALSDLVLETDGNSALPQFYYYLQQFINLGLICHTVQADGLPLATLVPISTPYKFQFSQVAPDTKYAMSRFAYCRKDNLQLVVESPLYLTFHGISESPFRSRFPPQA